MTEQINLFADVTYIPQNNELKNEGGLYDKNNLLVFTGLFNLDGSPLHGLYYNKNKIIFQGTFKYNFYWTGEEYLYYNDVKIGIKTYIDGVWTDIIYNGTTIYNNNLIDNKKRKNDNINENNKKVCLKL